MDIIKKITVLSVSIVFVFLCISSFCIVNAAEDSVNAADSYEKAWSLLTGFRKGIYKDQQEIYDTKGNKVYETIKNGWKDDNDDLKEILSKNKESIDEFKKATQITQCEFNFQGTIEQMHERYSDSRLYRPLVIAKLVLIEGRLFEREGKLDLALEDYFSVFQYANHLSQQKKVTQNFKILEIILRKYLYFPLVEILNNKTMVSQDYKLILGKLISLRNEKAGLENQFNEWRETFRYLARSSLERAKKEKGQNAAYFIYDNAFLRYDNDAFYKEYDALVDEFCLRLITAFKRNNVEEMRNQFNQEHGIDKAEAKLRKKYFSYGPGDNVFQAAQAIWNNWFISLSPSEAAKSYFNSISRDSISKTGTYYFQQVKLELLILATAIKLYESENNKPLSELNELVPQYLAEIPKDPFNNFEPLKYEKKDKGWIIYSFGQDKQDSHGVPLAQAFDDGVVYCPSCIGDTVFSSL